MRFLLVTTEGVWDTDTWERYDRLELSHLVSTRPGGIIVGRNLYAILSALGEDIRRDHGVTLKLVSKEDKKNTHVKGYDYYSLLCYRFEKERKNGVRYRPGSIKWPILNLENFCEPLPDKTELEDVESCGRALYALAEGREITVRASPGAFGSALYKKSPEWEKSRHAATHFISEDYARPNLPGNLYSLRDGYRTAKFVYYLDQESAHHRIALSGVVPHPHSAKAGGLCGRGRFHKTLEEIYGEWKGGSVILDENSDHRGLICARVECGTIPAKLRHLYPKWALEPGEHNRWIWTPELRLLDKRVRVRWITCAFTGVRADPVALEYAQWCLDLLKYEKHPAVKPVLVAAYGMLAVTRKDTYSNFSIHGRGKPPRATVVKRPLIGDVYRSDVKSYKPSVMQNAIGKGVIDAECLTRTIEMARVLENEGHKAVHLYADGLLTTAEQLPFLPEGWRVHATLTDVTSPHPNSILSREMTRMPGIPNGRRTAYIREDAEGERAEGDRPSFHLREQEPRPA